MLDALLARPGVLEHCELGARIGFLALHGGLEAGTAEIAWRAAARSGASVYAIVQPDGFRWHIPSHRHDPRHSEALAAFLAHVDVVVSVHGYGGLRASDRRWTTALVGGRDRVLARAIAAALRRSLPAYRWVDDLDAIPRHLRGVHPGNPVNGTRAGGVQIELPPRIRRAPDADTLVEALASFARGLSR
ncbi:MAG: hypothetical protein KatS3mg009_2734 [Acidimicrobiia bacterium]|nr:MAG: hypothetical protein KatS3mg009_2734 [Acidimicrobiia bacterium]